MRSSFPSLLRSFTVHMLALSTLFQFIALAQESKPTISVRGEAEIQLVADEIVIHASIESRAKTAADACKDNREKSRMLLEFLKSLKIEEQWIQTDLLSIDPIQPDPPSSKEKGFSNSQTNSDPFSDTAEEENPFGPRRRAIGYVAFRKFAIVVKDLKRFEEIYQGVVDKGINRVDSVRYRSTQEKAQMEKLRLQAVRNAKERGQAMAYELGAKLSAIKSISNSTGRLDSSGSSMGMGMGRGQRYGGDPFESDDSSGTNGRITLQSSVEAVFYLGNAEFKE